jgi:hypothetical protein
MHWGIRSWIQQCCNNRRWIWKTQSCLWILLVLVLIKDGESSKSVKANGKIYADTLLILNLNAGHRILKHGEGWKNILSCQQSHGSDHEWTLRVKICLTGFTLC